MRQIHLFFAAIRVPLDYGALLLAAISAYSIRFSPTLRSIRDVTFDLPFSEYLQVAAWGAVLWIIIFAFAGLYSMRPARLTSEVIRIGLSISTGIGLILMIAFFSRELFDSRFIFLAVWILSILFVSIERLIVRILQRHLRKKGYGLHKTIIIGKTKVGNELTQFFKQYPQLGYKIIAQYGVFSKDAETAILKKRNRGCVDTIIVAQTDIDRDTLDAIKAFADNEHLTFLYSAALFPVAAQSPIIHTFSGQPVIELPKTPLDGWGAIYKRIFDIFISLFLIVITFPIQMITAAILLTERQGSIFYTQKRVGRFGKEFTFIKFRSMVKDAHILRFDPDFIAEYGNDRDGTPLFKIKNDPRVTPFGKWIRKLSIDEFPQFYLVLLGHMSLVGPRPHLPEEVNLYEPDQRRVLTIKPGITGITQISGRASLQFSNEVSLDMHYIQNWSPLFDLIILLKTPFAVLLTKGAF